MVSFRTALTALFVTLALPVWAQGVGGGPFIDAVRDRLRNRLEAASATSPTLGVRGDRLHASTMLPEFYQRRQYAPAWLGESGLLPRARTLLEAVGRADVEGLRPADYHQQALEAMMAEIGTGRIAVADAAAGAAADLLLTDAFLLYGSHLLSGRVNPTTFDNEWHANRREADMAEVLERAVAANDVAGALRALLPAHAGYGALKQALARYRALAPWAPVPSGPTLRLADEDPRVIPLARRLRASHDLTKARPESSAFDPDVEDAVRRFQTRHGLTADGVVGASTLAALNVPLADRIEQIRINLERWRWLPQDLGRRHILVNIPAFEMTLVDDGRPTLEMRVVVGREYRQTPVFSGRITYLVLNPYWHVTRTIATQDKLPIIQRDPAYLAAQKIRVFEESGGGRREVDPSTIDWASLTRQHFPYQLRQDPGPQNALGQVKFMFPNAFNVYLHDTPSRELFSQTSRSFSSGCIRLERPLELARALLDGTPWTREAIDQALGSRQDVSVTLGEPVAVHLQYWTAWAVRDTVHLRPDIYGRDGRLSRALAANPPAAR